ncbi:TTN [Mytilus coruscus]|uniref:TTN n=1 Tax=Mytilus coruscus TaxID=42192 RepID=A0A6J8ABQ3_MYTCO|nr:TTN [Mytilus coruscus]
MTEEQENFYRHCSVIVDVLKHLFLQLIDFYLKIQGITFEDFIRKYQHEIYHLCVNMYPCCSCPTGTPKGYRDSTVLHDTQMNILLDKSGAKLPRHNPRSRSSPKCCCPVKTGISVQSLDVSLARVLLITFLVSLPSQERKAIDDRVNIRNNASGHATKGLMGNNEYRSSIDEITHCLLIIARICKKETEIKQMLSDALVKPLNTNIYIQLQANLLQQIEREDRIEKAIEKLKIAIEDLISPKDLNLSLGETFSRPLENKDVYEGHDVQFECEVTRSDFEGKWLKNGIELRKSQNICIEKDGRVRRLDIYGKVYKTGENTLLK